jgi:putative tricarboxylic transport membrane protein
MIRADFVTSLVLMLLGVTTLVESLRMPRFTDIGESPYSAPGLVPGILGVAVALLGLILCSRSVAALRAGAESEPGEGGWLRALAAFSLCGIYAIVLVSRVPFWLATFLFIVTFILGFEFADPEMRERPIRRIAVGVAIAAVATAAVSYVFQEIFYVRLP